MLADRSLHLPPASPQASGAVQRDYYGVAEAAAVLGVSRMSVWRWIRSGRLTAARLGPRTTRIWREDLERFLAEQERDTINPLGNSSGGPRVAPEERLADQGARRSSWREGGSADHVVQFYETDRSLLEAVSAYIGAALRAGQIGIVIATDAHRAQLEARLRADGLDLEAAQTGGQYVALSAAETLAQLMVEGQPDAGRFAEVVGSLVAGAAESGRRVRAFGEMVALLAAEGNHAAALRLEALWNGLQQVHAFSLFCAYPLAGYDQASAVLFDQVCSEHASVIPAESYTRLKDPDARLREIARLQHRAAALEAALAQRTRLEARLRRSEQELRDFVENATEGLHWVGEDGRILWANRAELELLGYPAEEYIGRHIAEFHVDQETIEDILCRLTNGEELHGYEARMRAKDGSIKYVLINANVYREDGRFIHTRCFTHDMTAHKLAAAAALRLAAIVESSDDAIIGKTLEGRIVDWNSGAERIYGYTAAEVVGQPIALLIPDDRPDELPAIMARLRRGERIEHFETERLTKTGRRITVSVTISPIRDHADQIIGVSAIARDISERLVLERMQRDLLAMVSHELRNPLTAIKGLAQLMQRRGAYNERALQGIVAQTNHLDRLVGDLLDVARLEAGRLELQCEPLDLVALVAENVEQAQAQTQAHALRLEAPAASVPGCFDRDRLNQVLQNLLGNALKYAPGGEVVVSLTTDSAEARISVADEGPGIPPEDAPKLFERFYRATATADGAKGLGIGLYVARMLVEAHGGRIWVEPRPRTGCEFVFTLPLGTTSTPGDET
jgi:PAS domain S-box-containing protein/excisionase family DNA binding protein